MGVDDDLLRSADRRRHRHAVQAEHQGDIRRSARLANLRDAGHPGNRQSRARQRRGRADGQYLGDAALFPRLRQRRRSVDPGRHQIYRRPFRHHVRLRVGQRGRRCPRSRPSMQRLGLCVGPGRHVSRAARLAHAWRVRLARHYESGLRVARWLEQRPEVSRVLHPALESDPGHAIWQARFYRRLRAVQHRAQADAAKKRCLPS